MRLPHSLRSACTATIACLSLAVCDFKGDLVVVPEFENVFSFEIDMEKWYPRGIDLLDPPVTWEIARTSERASDGMHSVRLRLDNLNAQGKIWIERSYEVAPDQEYEVEIGFALASADWGSIDLWQVLVGASPDSPTTADAVVSVVDTGNGETSESGVEWVEKSVTVPVESDEDGELFVYLGVWGTSGFSRTYDLDEVRVTLFRTGLSEASGPDPVR